MYYPTMNYMRFLFFFIPISMIYDFTYASFGGPIVSQLFYVMFNISSSGYFRNRDKIIYPFCDFLLIIIELGNSFYIFSLHISWTSLKCFTFLGKHYCWNCFFCITISCFYASFAFSLSRYCWITSLKIKSKLKQIIITKKVN